MGTTWPLVVCQLTWYTWHPERRRVGVPYSCTPSQSTGKSWSAENLSCLSLATVAVQYKLLQTLIYRAGSHRRTNYTRPYYTVWYCIIQQRGQKSPYNWSNFIKIVIYTLILYFIQICDSAWHSKVSEGRNDETDPLGAYFEMPTSELPNVVEI